MHRLSVLVVLAAAAACTTLGCETTARIPITYKPIDTDAVLVASGGSTPDGTGAAAAGARPECFFDSSDDLDSMVRGGDCDSPPPESYTLNARLGVKVVLSAPDVAPGGRIEVRMTFENLSSDKLPVYFYRSPTVKFPMQALDSKGRDVAYPDGALADVAAGSIARVVLLPKGTISVRIPFEAIRHKWKKNGKNKDLVEAGGLPKGNYQIRIRFPFAGTVGKAYAKYDIPVRVK